MQSFGLVAIDNKIDPAILAVDGVPIEELDQATLITIIEENVSKGKFRQLEREQPLAERTWEEVYQVVIDDVVQPKDIVGTWSLVESLTRKEEILAEVEQEHPQATVKFTSWIDPQFVTSPQSSDVLKAGVRTALLGTLLIIAITIVIALPIGIGAAIYLEEYASDNWVNRTIQTNINNLAGVPSIIYGMLGLGNLCSRHGANNQRSYFWLHRPDYRQRAHNSLCRVDPVTAGVAGIDHQRAGGYPCGAQLAARRGLWLGCHTSGRPSGIMCCLMPCRVS